MKSQVARAQASGELTADDFEVLKRWVSLIERDGPAALSTKSFWHDHELYDDWEGYRSSAFSKLGRIIYRVENQRVVVMVVRISTSHDYGGRPNRKIESK